MVKSGSLITTLIRTHFLNEFLPTQTATGKLTLPTFSATKGLIF